MGTTDKTSCYEDICQKHPLVLKHLEAVLAHNTKTNLTSITDYDAGKVLHIEDSLAALPELEQAPQGRLGDIGSGAGYPGIPLALVSGRDTTLIESNKKKADFLQDFINANKLERQITISPLRSEELARQGQEEAHFFSVVTARAVAELPVLLELAAPLLEYGGEFIALKAVLSEDEQKRALKAAEVLGLDLTSTRSFSLSNNKGQRQVLVYTKTKDSQVAVPRRPGMATKRPLA